MITTQQLEEALVALRGTSSEAKIRSLVAVLDEDHDGNINLEEVAEVCLSACLVVCECTCLYLSCVWVRVRIFLHLAANPGLMPYFFKETPPSNSHCLRIVAVQPGFYSEVCNFCAEERTLCTSALLF